MGIKGILAAFLKGFYHSFKGMLVITRLDKESNERRSRHSPTIRQKHIDGEDSPNTPRKKENSKVIIKVMQCAMLNGGIFLLSVLIFEYVLLPGLDKLFVFLFGDETFLNKVIWCWIKYILLLIYKTLWLVPMFIISKIINAFWFQDIADSAYRYSRGRPVSFPSISELFADSIFSIFVQILFTIQANLINYILLHPVGYILYMVQLTLLHSLYCFEYKWFNMGWKLHERLAFIEAHWAYFIGFGLPLTILTQLSDSLVISGCVFSILFPFFIISGNEASPVMDASDVQLQFFSLVIAFANTFFSNVIGSRQRHQSTSLSSAMVYQTARVQRR
ncbi:EI24 domain-containing protein tank [Rhynchophorus ferrugineus]|uniref:Etoposide-induced protein 2.4-like protein n=1 Tax=Rhynchophorus ferrugineus TaxID=354439 RepID=A0A834HTF9_RHYFE|nr:hypothetical protein GWI33_019904 [Rhynchophorus ferrugineus]